jgi:molybdopterin/thiamine biosynthesis adenylyltransferase
VVNDERLGAAFRALSAMGFTPAGNSGGVRQFIGTLNCRGSLVRIELHVEDWEFLSYPPIKVLDGINRETLAPHINPYGWLCYLRTGEVVLDRCRPDIAVAQCLEQARGVLEQIRCNPEYRKRDIQDEFLSHWLNGPSTGVIRVLMGTTAANGKSTGYWGVDGRNGVSNMLSDSAEEVARIAEALGSTPPKATTCPCWLFRSELPPAVPERMPGNVKELFKWLRSWDPDVNRELQAVLAEPTWQKYQYASFAIHTQAGWLGFAFALDPARTLATQRKSTAYRQYLHNHGEQVPLVRLWMEEIGPAFVHGRNLDFPSLLGKHVTVVGCGAIGSHVAEGLLRLGAGSGGGSLSLVDPEILEPENLGRHTLGYPSLYRPKALGLRDELARKFPLADVRGTVAKASEVQALFEVDLVVDATGEEPVSEQLNARRIGTGSTEPILHLWIVGNGDAVQALWAQNRTHACYRCCLLQSTADGQRVDRFPILEKVPERRLIGCKAFTPYAVGAPMAAAALGLEVIADWLANRDASPRFRTRLTARTKARRVRPQDVERNPRCPVCGDSHAA